MTPSFLSASQTNTHTQTHRRTQTHRDAKRPTDTYTQTHCAPTSSNHLTVHHCSCRLDRDLGLPPRDPVENLSPLQHHCCFALGHLRLDFLSRRLAFVFSLLCFVFCVRSCVKWRLGGVYSLCYPRHARTTAEILTRFLNAKGDCHVYVHNYTRDITATRPENFTELTEHEKKRLEKLGTFILDLPSAYTMCEHSACWQVSVRMPLALYMCTHRTTLVLSFCRCSSVVPCSVRSLPSGACRQGLSPSHTDDLGGILGDTVASMVWRGPSCPRVAI